MDIKPYQIAELLAVYPSTTTLSELSAVVLAAEGRTHTCPQCTGSGKIPNPEDEGATLIECPTCEGYGKTVQEYEEQCVEKRYIPKPPTP